MENNVLQLFVYGSLRSGFQHPAYEYISKYFRLVGEGKVKGYLYDMGDYPAAIPTTDDVYILGELYALKDGGDFSWAIEQLDAYEGVEPEGAEIPLYKRELATVYLENETAEAWIYWFNRNIENQPRIHSGDVFEFIHQKSKL
jgi:gamma-glutamylcyclotransferase (GGCT)/AIG2-like uncharacterized protein YtfP